MSLKYFCPNEAMKYYIIITKEMRDTVSKLYVYFITKKFICGILRGN